MPLPALLQIIDALLPASFDDFLSQILPCPEGCYFGARKGIQCLDIAHGLQTIIEKELDSLGAASLVQADIERYYDSLPVLRINWWLIHHGVPKAHAMCLLRHQMCPQVIFDAAKWLPTSDVEISEALHAAGSQGFWFVFQVRTLPFSGFKAGDYMVFAR